MSLHHFSDQRYPIRIHFNKHFTRKIENKNVTFFWDGGKLEYPPKTKC